MDREQLHFEQHKANLIYLCMRKKFEDHIYEKLDSMNDWTIEDVDAFVDKELKAFKAQKAALMAYYDERMANG